MFVSRTIMELLARGVRAGRAEVRTARPRQEPLAGGVARTRTVARLVVDRDDRLHPVALAARQVAHRQLAIGLDHRFHANPGHVLLPRQYTRPAAAAALTLS